MCCTLSRAELTDTILYAAEATLPSLETIVHVLGYQNRATNLSSGPNAMILPFPAAQPMGPKNIVDTSKFKRILDEYSSQVIERHVTRGGSKGRLLLSRSVQVFDSGMYTVVLADDARDIASALDRVPKNKRPSMNAEIFDVYSRWYPGWRLALCCFDAQEEMRPDPLLWWYVPRDPSTLFLPALDAHDGNAPRLNTRVNVDHSLIVGSAIKNIGKNVSLSDDIPEDVWHLLARRAIGTKIERSMPNGDFYYRIDILRKQELTFERLQPPGNG